MSSSPAKLTSLPLPEDLNFTLSPLLIEAACDKILADTRAAHDAVGKLELSQVSWQSTMQSLYRNDDRLNALGASVTFAMHVSSDAAVRAASGAASAKLDALNVELNSRKDVYARLKKLHDEQGDKLDALDKRLLVETLSDYERQGIHLEGAAFERLQAINTRLAKICNDFSQCMNEDNTRLLFADAELAGLPAEFVASLPVVDGKRELTLKYPVLFPVLQSCDVARTRQLMDEANASKCASNVALIVEAFELRRAAAQLLGFKSHAEFVLVKRMAKSPQAVKAFLEDLNRRLDVKLAAERDALLALKRADANVDDSDAKTMLLSHDWRYYQTLRLKREFAVDNEAIKLYFPLHKVIDEMLNLYQHLFGLKFVKVAPGDANHRVWHADVRQFNAFDDADQFLGTFYLDLHPRDGKYGHAAVFPLVSSNAASEDGARRPAVVAMLCNFEPSTDAQGSYLYHSEVVTLLHEFGHLVHGIVSRSKYSRFAGTNVERDFVEAPSQMLENWAFESSVLRKFSSHRDTNSTLPDELVAKLIAAKNAHTGIHNKRQLFFATIDQLVHSDQCAADTEKLWKELWLAQTGIGATRVGNAFASFGHLMGGYDAQYYGYLWSEVFSCDMFAKFKAGDKTLDAALGKQYRDQVLAPGFTRDSIDSLREFLGREPNSEAFMHHIGL